MFYKHKHIRAFEVSYDQLPYVTSAFTVGVYRNLMSECATARVIQVVPNIYRPYYCTVIIEIEGGVLKDFNGYASLKHLMQCGRNPEDD